MSTVTNFWRNKHFVNKSFEKKGRKVIIKTFFNNGIEIEEVDDDEVDKVLEFEESLKINIYDRKIRNFKKTNMF